MDAADHEHQSMTANNESAADIALRYLASFASGDPDRVAENVTEDFRNIQTGALGKGCVGRDVYRNRLEGFLASFEALNYEPVDVIVEDGKVSISYRMRCISGGRPVDIPGVMVMEVRGGLVASRRDYWDGVTFLQQTKQFPGDDD